MTPWEMLEVYRDRGCCFRRGDVIAPLPGTSLPCPLVDGVAVVLMCDPEWPHLLNAIGERDDIPQGLEGARSQRLVTLRVSGLEWHVVGRATEPDDLGRFI